MSASTGSAAGTGNADGGVARAVAAEFSYLGAALAEALPRLWGVSAATDPLLLSLIAALGAALLGLADVDAVTVSITHLGEKTLSEGGAVLAILIAVASNVMSKLAMGAAIGRGAFAVWLAVMSLGCLAVGGASLWATFAMTSAP